MLPSVQAMIREIVARPSVSSTDTRVDRTNRDVIDLIATWAEDVGLEVTIEAVPGRAAKWNLIASAGPLPDRRDGGLVLSGHTDTVPFDADGWASDPFVVTERGGRLFGLGTADMKSFFPLALAAIARVGVGSFRERLHLLGTADEECTMDGARALLARGEPRAARALIGEPTGLRPVRMHKGILMERIHLQGRSGHSSDPSLGVSALEAMRSVMNGLAELRSELADQCSDSDFAVPIPTINFGRIEGGDSPNRICGECSLDIDCRLVPPLRIDEIRARIRDRVRDALLGWDVRLEMVPLIPGTPALKTPADSEMVTTAESLTGHRSCAVGFCTEAPFLTDLGMDTIVLGAGDIAVAHQPNEHIAIADLDPAIDLYEKLIRLYIVDAARSSGGAG